MQLMLLLLIIELFLVLSLSPHPKWEDNVLMTISLVVLVVHSYSGAIYSVRQKREWMVLLAALFLSTQNSRSLFPQRDTPPKVAPNLPERYRRSLEVIDLLSIVLYCCGAVAMAAISLYSTGYVKADMVERASSMVEGASKSVVKSFKSFHSARALAALTGIAGVGSSRKSSEGSTSSLRRVVEIEEKGWEDEEDEEEKQGELDDEAGKRERYKRRRKGREKEDAEIERSVREIELSRNPLHHEHSELNGRDLFISQPSAASWNLYNRGAESAPNGGSPRAGPSRRRRREEL